jgi:putative addiction module component (TIGR02574 family)
MAVAIEKLKAELGELTEQERADLAHFLLVSLDKAPAGLDGEESQIEEAWAAELGRRGEEIESDKAVGKPADQLFNELRAKYS